MHTLEGCPIFWSVLSSDTILYFAHGTNLLLPIVLINQEYGPNTSRCG